MKISYNWIKDYINIDADPEKIAEILTSIGLEIEGTEEWVSVDGGLEGIITGEVLTCQKHPDADKLSVTTVDIGKGQPLHIVCGAPNVAAGQKVLVAPAGSFVFHGGERFELKKTKIRGEISEGMICAEDEIGLGSDHQGIIVLDSKTPAGMPASEYFKVERDFIFEIGLTPNRIDSGSHYGVARDLAAYLNVNGELKTRAQLPSLDSFRVDNNDNPIEIIVENKADCPRYSGITISNVTIGESPEWLKNKLRAIGLNPINNVVDITNFVQHEVGQPLHAFDADKITGKKVFVRNLPDKSKFITLDSVERDLSEKDLMICNSDEGMCIAGVFGGIRSGVTSSTKNIFLESAYFNPVSIRKTSKRHTLKTDASFRFERGADPEITTWALKRASILIREIAGGSISSDIKDIYPVKINRAVIDLNFNNVNRLIGKVIDKEIIRRILSFLDIIILSDDDLNLRLEIPAYRVDVRKEADVIEEILRIYGYNNIEISNHLNSCITYQEKPDRDKLRNIIADMLSSNGFAEIMCNSLNPAEWYQASDDFDNDKLVLLANPLSSDLNAMRQSLLYGGLSSVSWNINRQNTDLKLYEFGNCYFINNKTDQLQSVDDYTEKSALDLFITGNTNPSNWNLKSSPGDFFKIKSFTEMVLTRLGIVPETLAMTESDKKYFSDSLVYLVNKKPVAEVGRISKNYLQKLDIKQDVFYSHIEWDILLNAIKNYSISFRELPKYPSVRRDLALLVDRSIKFSQIRDLSIKTERNILQDIRLFDVYESNSLGQNKKSYAVSFILRDDLRTLTDKNIEKVMNNLIKVFQKELDAQVR